MDAESFTIKTETFEGPLELLLGLIEKRKLFINDISLAQVADDYIEHIRKQTEFPMGMTAHFILIASTLLLIKSKSLLPALDLTEDEEGSIEDLETRLKMYQKVRDVSKQLEKIFGKEIIFSRNREKNITPVFSPTAELKPQNILESMKRVIASLPKTEFLPKVVVKKIISLEEMIVRLTERVKSNLKINFSEFAKTQGQTKSKGASHQANKSDKVAIIVSFLAMLELVKQGLINVHQESFSEDISMETQNLEVPNYH
jgi:segregation and condensation protein A